MRRAMLSVSVLCAIVLGACAGLGNSGSVASAAKPPALEPAAPEPAAPEPAEEAAAGARSDDMATSVPGSALEFSKEAPARTEYKSASGSMGLGGTSAVPSASGLKAGYSDDNMQFNYFVNFLKQYDSVPHYPYDISERITIRVLDSAGKPVANARVTISSAGSTLTSGLSYADGSFRFYPAALGPEAGPYDVRAESGASTTAGTGAQSTRISLQRDGPRLVELHLAGPRVLPSPVPLDVLFVMDTTGSMGEEIERLKSTIDIIHANLAELKPRPLVRFGLVLYKDRGDEYITRVVPLTDDLESFQRKLAPVTADGGGDGPEDLESALDDVVNRVAWNKNGLRLAFVVTDAEPHLDYGRDYTYIKASTDARARAIKLFTIGTGGLPLEGEYVLRQVAQLTDAKYIFLTYGERGESTGGAEGSVSHHTGSNFQTDKLESIIIKFVKEEVAQLSDTPVATADEYFDARKVQDESRDQTLGTLFGEAIGNLADYSTYQVTADTPCVVLPVAVSGDGLGPSAEYFGERLVMAAAEAKRWKPVERKDLQKILSELELQLSGLVDEGSAARVGSILGADVMVAPTLYKRADRYELFLKLIRVSTAEVLSVTRAKIDLDLGL